MNQGKVSKKNSRITGKKNNPGKSAEASPKGYKMLYEQEVVKNRALYLSFFKKNEAIMLILDPSDGRILDANDATVKFHGYPYETLTQMHTHQLIVALSKKELAKIRHEAHTGKRNHFTGQHRLANNEIRDVEMHSERINYENKEVIIATIYDITEQAKTHKALEESEIKFRKMFKISPDAIAITHLESGLYIEINEGFTVITGYTRDEIVGKTASEANIWADIKERKKLHLALKEKGFVKDYPSTFRMKNGDIVHASVSANIIKIKGEPHIISITRNIEDYIKATKALQHSERRYRTLFHLSPAGILLLDEAGTILEANPAYYKNIGYTAKEIVGEKIWKVVNNPLQEKKEQILSYIPTIPRNKIVEKEVVNIRKNGELLFLHLYETSILLENNQTAILSISIDVTREKHIHEKLVKNTERLKEAQEIGKIGSWELNWQTKKLYWSDEMYRLLELNSSQKPDYECFQQVIHPEDLKTAREVLKKSVKNGTPFKYIHRFWFKDGRIKWVIERGKSFYDKNGKVIRTHGTVQDITQLKETEDKLKELNGSLEKKVLNRTAKLKKKQRDMTKLLNDMQVVQQELRHSNHALKNLNHELEAFSYSVSHDLKAPLRAIRGFTTIIKEDYFSTLDENEQVLINDILSETDGMSEIIDALLQLSRTGRKNLNFVEFDLKQLARSIFSEQQKEYNLPHADFKIHELPPVFADYTLIKQLMANLLSNALKYSSRQPRPLVEIGYRKDNETKETVFYVKDNGVGFDEEAAGKIFMAFCRLHSKKDFEGTGIGLAIAKRIVSRHGGKIWAKSKTGEGTTLFFTLSGSNKQK